MYQSKFLKNDQPCILGAFFLIQQFLFFFFFKLPTMKLKDDTLRQKWVGQIKWALSDSVSAL